MKVVMEWPIGRIKPREVVDVDPRFGAVLCREGFAHEYRSAPGSRPPPSPKAPTVREVMAYAREHGLSTTAARDALAAEIRDRAAGAAPTGGPA